MTHLQVEIFGQDRASLEFEIVGDDLQVLKFEVTGCRQFLKLANELRPQLKGPVSKIPLPRGKDHSSFLLRELVLKLQDRWNPPYNEEEVCHCRIVETKRVVDAIYTGCRNASSISQKTTAGTSCGSCRPDLEALLKYFLRDET